MFHDLISSTLMLIDAFSEALYSIDVFLISFETLKLKKMVGTAITDYAN